MYHKISPSANTNHQIIWKFTVSEGAQFSFANMAPPEGKDYGRSDWDGADEDEDEEEIDSSVCLLDFNYM